ncbi:MAG: hypothetical protein SA339_10275 [Methanomassiliicoccus sp.]|nr:hypothetical protein [Methanomassiliicoccus sp.]
MNNEMFKVLAILEAVTIVFLVIVFVSISSLSNASSGSDTSLDDTLFHFYGPNSNGSYVVVQELMVKNMVGSVNFTVDGNWNAIGIYVQGISGADVIYTETPPDNPAGATIVNGTALPFMYSGPFHVNSENLFGATTVLDNQTSGNWTLHYDVQGGPVKIYIVEAQLPDL